MALFGYTDEAPRAWLEEVFDTLRPVETSTGAVVDFAADSHWGFDPDPAGIVKSMPGVGIFDAQALNGRLRDELPRHAGQRAPAGALFRSEIDDNVAGLLLVTGTTRASVTISECSPDHAVGRMLTIDLIEYEGR